MTQAQSSKSVVTIRTGLATQKAVAKLNGEFPYFVHKWTRHKRHYVLSDLALPDSIFVRGTWPLWNAPVIGVGGTRSPTVETFCLVSKIIGNLANRGFRIISGGVPGVDLAAHIAAADELRSSTFAVLANPVALGLRGHEWSSRSTEDSILRRGAFLSEYAEPVEVGSDMYCERLLARDRIISGLCDAFLVFECNEDSATVDTARRAILQGKQVVCVEAVRSSVRRGIDQLAAEFSLPVFSERKLSHTTAIAEGIVRFLRPDMMPEAVN